MDRRLEQTRDLALNTIQVFMENDRTSRAQAREKFLGEILELMGTTDWSKEEVIDLVADPDYWREECLKS